MDFRGGPAELVRSLTGSDDRGRVVVALVAGVAAAASGYWLGWGDGLSLAFVSLATVVWAVFVAALLSAAGRIHATSPSQSPPKLSGWLPAGQAVLVSIGLFGTFFGLSIGLKNSIPYINKGHEDHAAMVEDVRTAEMSDNEAESAAMQEGMSHLLNGAQLAFSKSVAGIGLGLAYLLLFRLVQRRRRERELEAIAALKRRTSPEEAPVVQALIKLQHSVDRLAVRVQPPSLEPVLGELRALRAAQPDGDELRQAASALARGASALSNVAGNLETIRADVIGQHVAQGVQTAVSTELAPTMAQIREELTILKELKRETDELVKTQLTNLIKQLYNRALKPITEELQQVGVATTRVTEQVATLAGTVAESTEAVRATSDTMGSLTTELARFQQQALTDLQAFATRLDTTLADFTDKSGASFEAMGANIERSVDVACKGMEAQRAAFDQSAKQATDAFAAQTETITTAGATAAQEIERAGAEARGALQEVRGEFAQALSAQRQSLEGVLESLDGAFRRDLEQRQEFERITGDSIRKVQALVQRTSAMEALLSQAAPTVLAEMVGTLQSMATQHQAQRDEWARIEDSLAKHLEALQQRHEAFVKDEDAQLTRVLAGLHQLVGTIAEANQVVTQQKSLGVRRT